MKALYVNINEGQVHSTDSYEVINYNLLDDFFFFLGDAIVGNTKVEVNKIDLIKAFNTPENASDFDKIIKQWKELKMTLLSERPEGSFKVTIPNAFVDWLKYNRYEIFKSICVSEKLNSYINLNINEFYNDCISRLLINKITSCLKKDKTLSIIIINDSTIEEDSLFISEICRQNDVMFMPYLDFCDIFGLGKVRKDGNWGYVDRVGYEIIPCKYIEAHSFSEGFAAVKSDNNKWKFINYLGNNTISLEFDNADSFKEGLAFIKKGNLCGFIHKDGHDFCHPQFQYVDGMLKYVKEDYFSALQGTYWGYIHRYSFNYIPFNYDAVGYFSEGFACVVKNGCLGYVDKNGNEIIPCRFANGNDFSEGMAAIMTHEYKWGYINKKGEIIISCKYDDADFFREGLAVVCKGGNYGCIDNEGNEMLPFIFEHLLSFKEDLFAACYNGKWGYVNKNGVVIIPFSFEEAMSFHAGLATVKKDGMWGFINKKGNIEIPCIYECAASFSGNIHKLDGWLIKQLI